MTMTTKELTEYRLLTYSFGISADMRNMSALSTSDIHCLYESMAHRHCTSLIAWNAGSTWTCIGTITRIPGLRATFASAPNWTKKTFWTTLHLSCRRALLDFGEAWLVDEHWLILGMHWMNLERIKANLLWVVDLDRYDELSYIAQGSGMFRYHRIHRPLAGPSISCRCM